MVISLAILMVASVQDYDADVLYTICKVKALL